MWWTRNCYVWVVPQVRLDKCTLLLLQRLLFWVWLIYIKILLLRNCLHVAYSCVNLFNDVSDNTTVCFIPWTHQHIIEMRSVLLITLPVALIIFINLTSADDSQAGQKQWIILVIKAFQIKSVLITKMSSSFIGSYRLWLWIE